MAKNIGIGTLAEGVETKEHLEFLKEIGCGKIQGYYYGRPESIDDMFEHLKEKGISIEARKWRHFYETASFNVRLTDRPLEIIPRNCNKSEDIFDYFKRKLKVMWSDSERSCCGFNKLNCRKICDSWKLRSYKNGNSFEPFPMFLYN